MGTVFFSEMVTQAFVSHTDDLSCGYDSLLDGFFSSTRKGRCEVQNDITDLTCLIHDRLLIRNLLAM